MKLTFFGAAHAVTGSCHCVEANRHKVLIDCGLQQGKDETDNRELDFAPSYIDDMVVTHAHIDHSGRIPLLVKQGFAGNIYCTRLTAQLLSIMLRDSAQIQENDAAYENQKGKRAGRPPVEPLYTLPDVEKALRHIVTVEYGQEVDITDGIKIRFVDAGHLLGSACVEMWLTENGVTKKIVFSGDIGNKKTPIIRSPQPICEADYVVTESTYGDRLHNVKEKPDYSAELAEVIDDTLSRGGNLVIPSFAVGRTQELLYFIRQIKEQHLVLSDPDFQVYVDSPLAGAATEIFSGDLTGYLDEDSAEKLRGGALFRFPGLNITESTDESRGLNLDPQPKVIISASGMCDAGRIRHHLKYNLWREECTIVFVGFQAPGTLGRTLLEGADTVRLFGEDVAVLAEIENFKGLSSHADRDHLLEWAQSFENPTHFFVVHGDREVAPYFAESLEHLGLSAHAPQYTEVYDLANNCQLERGYLPERRTVVTPTGKESGAYQRLAAVGKLLQEVILRSKGRTNKDMARLADQIKQLIDKWEA